MRRRGRCLRRHRCCCRTCRRRRDRKSTRLNSSHTEIYTLSLHDALPIWLMAAMPLGAYWVVNAQERPLFAPPPVLLPDMPAPTRSEEHTSELQSHRDLHSFPTRRSSDLADGGDATGRLLGGECAGEAVVCAATGVVAGHAGAD